MKKGFTLIELLLVIGFIMLISTWGFLAFNRGGAERDLEYSNQKIVALLRQARDFATSQSLGSDWGVRFVYSSSTGISSYALFYSTYSASTQREFATLPKTLRFATTTFTGGTKDVIFENLTGRSLSSTTIRFFATSNPTLSSTLYIASSGLVTY